MPLSDNFVEVYPLAEFLCDEILARGWTTKDVADRMGGDPVIDQFKLDLFIAVSPTEDNLLLDDETVMGLSLAFGVSEDFFRHLHDDWLSHPEKRASFEAPENVFPKDEDSHYTLHQPH